MEDEAEDAEEDDELEVEDVELEDDALAEDDVELVELELDEEDASGVGSEMATRPPSSLR